MAEEDDGFNEETFKGFGEDPAPVAPPAEPPKEEDPKEEPQPPETPPTGAAVPTPSAPAEGVKTDDNKQEEEGAQPPKPPETPPAPEPAQPLTKDDVSSVVRDLLNTERNSSKELDNTTKEVMDAYYPDGLSNVLIDQNSGKELRTPQDVVDASNGEMSTEQAAQWLMNEQFRLDSKLAEIKDSAKKIAETTVNFKRDAVAAVQKYEPLFKAYPTLQEKVYNKLMKQVKVDKDKGVILSAPDVIEHYDDYLEPYQQAFEFATKQSATNPTPPATPEPPKPTAEDRMDETGDGGGTAQDDPNDFAQQVKKELAKGF